MRPNSKTSATSEKKTQSSYPPHHNHFLLNQDTVTEPFESLDPSGRVPATIDPNTSLTLWESGAIVEYLLATCDPSSTLSYTSLPVEFSTQSWLHFKTSGQGPHFGQRAWFVFYHPEKNLKSVLDRYGDGIWRATGVLDAHLKKSGG